MIRLITRSGCVVSVVDSLGLILGHWVWNGWFVVVRTGSSVDLLEYLVALWGSRSRRHISVPCGKDSCASFG